jgi:TetR/AcrR family tetracycline transcriptional repressor
MTFRGEFTRMSPEEEKQALTRERLVAAALLLIKEDGLDGLSMRALAEQLDVKAASLYWHVRDRRELVELLAESILESVKLPRAGAGWRKAVLDIGAALGQRVSAQKDADRILLEVPESLESSDTFAELKRQLQSAGLQPAEAGEVARMVMVHVITGRAPEDRTVVKEGYVAKIAVDSGSRGVALKRGSDDMQGLIQAAHDRGVASPAITRGDTVVVRRLRGVGLGEIELNPHHPWRFQIQGATWNTVVDAGGLDVREIKFDSGAAKAEVFLPMPRGVVPIEISSGVVGVTIHRPAGAAAIADVHTGAVRLKLDDYSSRAVITDFRWASEGATGAKDRYEIRINSGVVQLTLDTGVSGTQSPIARAAEESRPTMEPVSALELLLDGVESRVRR